MPTIFSSGLSFSKRCRFYLLRLAHDPSGVIFEYDLRFRSRFILPDQVEEAISPHRLCLRRCPKSRGHMCVELCLAFLLSSGDCVCPSAGTSLNLSVGRSSVSEVQKFSKEVFCLLAQPQMSANILRGKYESIPAFRRPLSILCLGIHQGHSGKLSP